MPKVDAREIAPAHIRRATPAAKTDANACRDNLGQNGMFCNRNAYCLSYLPYIPAFLLCRCTIACRVLSLCNINENNAEQFFVER